MIDILFLLFITALQKSQSKIEIYFKSCVDLAIQRWKMRKKYTYLICIFSVEVETSINVKKCNISGLLQLGIGMSLKCSIRGRSQSTSRT